VAASLKKKIQVAVVRDNKEINIFIV